MLTTASATRSTMILVLSAVLAGSGCATTRPAAAAAGNPMDAQAVLAEYVQRLPAGTPVRVQRAEGGALRGTLMRATGESIVVQPSTRLPEPPVEVPVREILSVTPERGNGYSVARAIGAGAVAGSVAALTVFLIILAAYAD